MSGSRCRHHLEEVQSPSIAASGLSGCYSGFHSFQGFSLPAESREAMLNRRRISVLLYSTCLFVWRRLLGVLSSLTPLILGGRLWIRPLQLRLHRLWVEKDDSTVIPWVPVCRQDLEWWLVPGRLQAGVSLAQVNPHLDFWSDVGWGAVLTSWTQPLPAAGLGRKLSCPTQGSFLRWSTVYGTNIFW